jgi:Putative MetA-pathway of phenol degradation
MKRHLLTFAVALAPIGVTAWADEAPAPDKSGYSLFNPTPDAALRGLCTDRPTKSTGPCTLDAGRLQVEVDLLDRTVQHLDGVRTRTDTFVTPTIKLGVTRQLDVELSYAPSIRVQTRASGVTETVQGGGDLVLRAKYNLVGADSGALAIAVSPFLKLPTAGRSIGNGKLEGGVVMPVQYTTADGVQLLTDPEVDILEDADGRGTHINLVNLISVTRPLSRTVSMSAELWTDTNFEPTKTVVQASLDLGLAWIPASLPTWQVDGGINFGLNRSTPVAQVYAGLSHRF